MPTGDRPQSSLADPRWRARLGPVALGLGTALALAAGLVVAWSVVSTASARISGATANPSSLLQAAVIELTTDGGGDAGDGTPASGSGAELAIDAAGLHPGRVLERCVQLRYRGTLDAVDVVLSARIRGGTGLDRYLGTMITVGRGTDPDCADFTLTRQRFDGTLAELASTHGDYERGLVLSRLGDDLSVTVRFAFEVRSDDEAQGRSTDVTLRFEVRP